MGTRLQGPISIGDILYWVSNNLEILRPLAYSFLVMIAIGSLYVAVAFWDD